MAIDTHPNNGRFERVSKFAAHLSETPEPGLRHVKVDVERTFRSGEELNAWLLACVGRLTQDVMDEGD